MATAVETAPPPVVAEKAPVATPPVVPANTPAPAAVVPTTPAAEPLKSLLAETPVAEVKPGDAPAPVKPPEAVPVEWKLEAPKDSGYTSEQIKAFEEWAKPEGMTPAQAQKVLEREAAAKALAVKQGADRLTQANDTWKAESQTKFGAKLAEVVDNAQRALRTYDTTGAVTKILKDTAMGSNAAVLELLARVGAGLREDAPAGGTTAPPAPKSTVERFFGKDHTKPSTNR